MGDLPDGWANYNYKGYAIRKRTLGGLMVNRLEQGHWDSPGRFPARTIYNSHHPKITRILVLRHGAVVNRFLKIKSAKAWINSQRKAAHENRS